MLFGRMAEMLVNFTLLDMLVKKNIPEYRTSKLQEVKNENKRARGKGKTKVD
jgi:hypothetical protein